MVSSDGTLKDKGSLFLRIRESTGPPSTLKWDPPRFYQKEIPQRHILPTSRLRFGGGSFAGCPTGMPLSSRESPEIT